jgi:hypothetical protein
MSASELHTIAIAKGYKMIIKNYENLTTFVVDINRGDGLEENLAWLRIKLFPDPRNAVDADPNMHFLYHGIEISYAEDNTILFKDLSIDAAKSLVEGLSSVIKMYEKHIKSKNINLA